MPGVCARVNKIHDFYSYLSGSVSNRKNIVGPRVLTKYESKIEKNIY